MPHYKDGTEAKIGDRVRGTGYNAESKGYDPAKGIEGVVTDVRPGVSCTLSVAYLSPVKPDATAQDGTVRYYGTVLHVGGAALRVQEEYGDTRGFEKVG